MLSNTTGLKCVSYGFHIPIGRANSLNLGYLHFEVALAE